ncbi:MAG TPA: T9SS type A sorting domain-containing protein [Edaphocola sp.]|nr:T9SS type A sorting domain-containing protein [Edaphocola sp.]
MKKVYLSLFLATCMAGAASAQQSTGGFPMSSEIVKVQDQKVAHIELSRPDYASIMRQNLANETKGIPGPYMVAAMVNADVSLSNSGTWTYLEDGSKIWRLSVMIPDAKAVGILYDQFKLPKGVKLFISNENGRQILGAYTAENNDLEYGKFANEPVQGTTANIEMDIPSGVNAGDIVFHIDRFSAYYRGVDELTRAFAAQKDPTPAKPTGTGLGSSAPCNIDANCPLPAIIEGDYTIPKKASVQIIIQGNGSAGFCSGTLINNTGNVQNGTCIPYVLTASHCDESNSYSSADFSQWLFRFKYRYDSCGGHTLPDAGGTHTTMVGADFKARSFFPSIGTFTPGQALHLVGDFLLLQLKSTPPSSYDTYLAGWNRSNNVLTDPNTYNFFIGFHYPHGDVEKLSYSTSIQGNGNFNQNQVPATHWHTVFAVGGTQPGSSGSGLFDVNGRVIGDLSGGVNSGCGNDTDQADFGTDAEYSKISHNWENDFDQTNHASHAGSQSRLKDWLDPTGSGAMQVNALRPDCTPLTGILHVNNDLENNIQVYPTPSADGIVHARIKLDAPMNFQVNVYNTVGRLVKTFTVDGAYHGVYTFDCANLANGMYIMKFAGAKGIAAKKIIIAR